MKDSLIASHLLGGTTGHNLKKAMTDPEIETTVSAAMRVTQEIKKQVTGNYERLMIGHLLGGTSGVKLALDVSTKEIEAMVGIAARVVEEMDKQLAR
jgi:NaMN:DMB phosphoribosyltransferase